MKVIEKNGKIFLQADFKKLTDKEHNFMQELSFRGIWFGEFDKDGDAPFVYFETVTPSQLRDRYKYMEFRAWFRHIEITAEVKAIFDNQENIAKVWEQEERVRYAHEEHIEQLKKAIELAYDVRESGCHWCLHNYLDRDTGKYMCRYTNRQCYKKSDEAELEFYAQREARILRAENWYWARPFPMPGCEVLLKGRQAEIELQELEEKEKEGENNGKI